MYHSGWLPVLILLPIAALAVGCRDSTAPVLDPRLAAGTYVLDSVAGRGPADGTVVLTSDGAAERRVRYAQSTGTLSREYVALGSFRAFGDGRIELRLREDSGKSAYEWRIQAEFTSGVVIIRHPDPADGPEIVEVYRRR